MRHLKTIFEISFSSVPEPVAEVWLALTSYLKNEKCLPNSFYLSQIEGHDEKNRSENKLKLNSDGVLKVIKNRSLYGFHAYTGHSDKSVAYSLKCMLKSGRQASMSCRLELKTKAPASWAPFIESVAKQWITIGSWQWNHAYAGWQRYCLVEDYEVFYGAIPRKIITYTQKSPCPLSKDREMIDISLNPGRFKQLITGVCFYPAAEMWLGPHFWQYAKCTKEEALTAGFWLETRDTPHFTYFKCWPKPFSRPDGEQGRMQQRLWNLFFHEDCEWPPGSGTISDEPMYGPKELWPEGLEYPYPSGSSA